MDPISYKGDIVALVKEVFDAKTCGDYGNIVSIQYEILDRLL